MPVSIRTDAEKSSTSSCLAPWSVGLEDQLLCLRQAHDSPVGQPLLQTVARWEIDLSFRVNELNRTKPESRSSVRLGGSEPPQTSRPTCPASPPGSSRFRRPPTRELRAARCKTVFDRMEVTGLPCVGREHPNGSQADPWPKELPRDSRNVPALHRGRQSPETATRQLDYVFASTELAERLSVRALNAPEEWGPSDHCRIEVEFEEAP